MTNFYLKVFVVVILLAMFNACEDGRVKTSCGSQAVISDKFDSVISDEYSMVSVSLNDQCLTIEISAGGCDGDSWKADLLVSKMAELSMPPYISLRLVLEDDELCEALVKKRFHFDLQPLEEFGERLILSIEGWEETIPYPGLITENIIGSWSLTNVRGGLIGADDKFEKGLITWTFDGNRVDINNQNTENSKKDSFDSGIYPYKLFVPENQSTWYLQVDDYTLGSPQILNSKRMVIPRRASSDFVYIFEK